MYFYYNTQLIQFTFRIYSYNWWVVKPNIEANINEQYFFYIYNTDDQNYLKNWLINIET